jgi:hypothetical protein
MMTETGSSSVTSVSIYQTAHCNIPKGGHLHTRFKNPKFHQAEVFSYLKAIAAAPTLIKFVCVSSRLGACSDEVCIDCCAHTTVSLGLKAARLLQAF